MRAPVWSKAFVVAVMAGVWGVGQWSAPPEALAQCKRQCGPGEKRDGKGCCVSDGSQKPSQPQPVQPAAAAPSCPTGMVGIPGGTYTLGERKDSAKVKAFCLDKTEVTIDAYTACVKAGACTEPDPYRNDQSFRAACNWQRPGAALHPVNCVDWSQAMSFCGWASKQLPSEEEWEWAARGGDRATTYPWGNDAPSANKLNACGSECTTWMENRLGRDYASMYWPDEDDGWPTTAPVGSFPKGANRWGVQDLAGNVSEWTSNRWSAADSDIVTRGGCWYDDVPSDVRAADREGRARSMRLSYLGFRCARVP